jgi:hypothetical protein
MHGIRPARSKPTMRRSRSAGCPSGESCSSTCEQWKAQIWHPEKARGISVASSAAQASLLP